MMLSMPPSRRPRLALHTAGVHLDCDSLILPGNHDSPPTQPIYNRHAFSAGASRVHVIHRLDGEIIMKPRRLDILSTSTIRSSSSISR